MARGTCRLALRAGIPVVSVLGEVDISNVDHVKTLLQRAEACRAEAVIVSLTGASYLCVRVFGLLIALSARLARDDGRRLVVVCPRDRFARRVIAVLRSSYPVAERVDEALVLVRGASETRRATGVVRHRHQTGRLRDPSPLTMRLSTLRALVSARRSTQAGGAED